jgi:N-acyl-D-amino-acid deacylase
MRWICTSLVAIAWTASALADEPVRIDKVRQAVSRGLNRIGTAADRYAANRTCFSCHHQLCIPIFAAARDRGLPIDRPLLTAQIEFTRESFRSKIAQIASGQGVGGANTTVAYALMTLESADEPASDLTRALVLFLVARQAKDGSWPAVTDRPPSEGSAFTNAALALQALSVYGRNDPAFSENEKSRIESARGKGIEWLLKNRPKSMEDRTFHLRALIAGGVEKERIEESQSGLIQQQNANGSWSQLPELPGDAYATALALIALQKSGLDDQSRAVSRGVSYLVQHQLPDGSWFVQTRSKPIQVFFDNGDPGGKSQFISNAATNWAVLALLGSLPKQ